MVSEMIEDFLLDKYNSEGDDHWQVEDGVYHASDVSKCPRKVYYKHKNEKKELDLSSCKNFEREKMSRIMMLNYREIFLTLKKWVFLIVLIVVQKIPRFEDGMVS